MLAAALTLHPVQGDRVFKGETQEVPRARTHPGWSSLPRGGDHSSDLVGALQRHSIHTHTAPHPTPPPTSFSVLGMNPQALHVLGKLGTVEPHPTPLLLFLLG